MAKAIAIMELATLAGAVLGCAYNSLREMRVRRLRERVRRIL